MANNYNKELFFGNTLTLKSGLRLKQVSLQEIEDSVGYDAYYAMAVALTRYNYEFVFDFEDSGLDYTQYNACSLFFLLALDNPSKPPHGFLECLELFFEGELELYDVKGERFIKAKYKDEKYAFYDKNTADEVRTWISHMFYFTQPKKRRPANEAAKKLIKRQIAKQRKASQNKYDMYSLMNALYWSENYSDNRDRFLNFTPHQIYSGYFAIEKINNFHYTLHGIYSGTIEQKNISFEKINWINKIT